ncbi:MAG TPA: hypothetical protein VMZ52_19545 [Bryobacteraceae bacterium]|nr:hypothetical protein [Bryobacteraceae bacterium]
MLFFLRKRVTAALLPFTLLFPTQLLVAQAPAAPQKLNIVILEGEGAINNIRQRVAREPIVQVEDENHKPVAGAAVTFFLPNQGAGGLFANGSRSLTVLTDDKGQAIARGIRPNNVNGQYQIRVNASYQGQMANAVINQVNAIAAGAAAASAGVSGKLIAIIAVAGAAVAGGVVAATRGGGGAPATGGAATPVGAVVTPGTPTVGAPR